MNAGPGRGAPRVAFVLHLHGIERAPEAGAGAPDNYPPYDLLRVGRDTLHLVFAVAGFAPDQLEIACAGDQLVVSGERPGDGDPGRFLHRGIAARRFRRAFRLGPGLDVLGAEAGRGLLTVALGARPGRPAARTVAIGIMNQRDAP